MKRYQPQQATSFTRKKIFYSLIFGVVLSFALYGFGITTTTLSIAEARTYNRDIVDLQTEITELEFEYFQMVNALSIEQALEFGFSEERQVYYAHLDTTKSIAYNY